MKTVATLALLLALAAPAGAVVVHDEVIHGDLSSLAATPTPLVFALGAGTVTGTVRLSDSGTGDRDFITFNIPAGHRLATLNLLVYAPPFIGFCAFNAGTTSWVPSFATDANFLAGIHLDGSLVAQNLMPYFVDSAVTTNALSAPELGPGDYCFVIQQAGSALQSYSLEFVVDAPTPAHGSTWGAIKSLYQ